MYNPYNAIDLDYSGAGVVATGLLSGAALFPLAAEPVTQPDAVLAIDGFAAGAEWSGDQLYTVSAAACYRGFHVYDVTDPTRPVEVPRTYPPGDRGRSPECRLASR